MSWKRYSWYYQWYTPNLWLNDQDTYFRLKFRDIYQTLTKHGTFQHGFKFHENKSTMDSHMQCLEGTNESLTKKVEYRGFFSVVKEWRNIKRRWNGVHTHLDHGLMHSPWRAQIEALILKSSAWSTQLWSVMQLILKDPTWGLILKWYSWSAQLELLSLRRSTWT